MLNKSRTIVLVFFCLFIIFSVFCATGESEIKKGWKEYQIRDLDMSIHFPEDYSVIYKDMNPDDSILLNYGVTPEQINIELGDQYLNAYSETYNAMYYVLIYTSGIPFESEELTQEKLVRDYINGVCIEAEKNGSEVINVIIDNDEYGFYGRYELRQQIESSMIRTYTYCTYKNSVLICMVAYVMEDEYVDEFRIEANHVFDSIRYGNVIGGNEAGIRYEDRAEEVSFLWPAGYYRPYSEPKQEMLAYDVFIKGIPNDRVLIQYMCVSLVTDTDSIQDKIALNRLDTDKMSLSDYMELVGSHRGKFFEEYHGQHKFFKRYRDSVEMYAIKNTKMYCFMYSGEEDDEYYSDFIKLVDSVMFADDVE